VARTAHRTHDRRIMIAMTIYIIVLLCVWPLAKAAGEPVPKFVYALTPVLPLFYVIWAMGQKIRHSDELEQRTHLIGIGVAAAAISVISIVSGFLAAANAITLAATSAVLMWIFPLMMLIYGAARSHAARRYGGGACDEDERLPLYLRLLWAAALLALAAAYLYFRSGHESAAGTMLGMAVAMAFGSAIFAVRRWRRQRTQGE
jgi:hypothetical protein